MRNIGLLLIIGVALAAALAAGLYVSHEPHEAAHAQPEDIDLAGYEYLITWAPQNPTGPPTFTISAQSHTTVGVNLIATNPISNPLDLSDEVLDDTSPHKVQVVDLGGAEANPPYTRGVLGRYSATVGAEVPPGLYDLDFTRSDGGEPVYPPPIIGTSDAEDLCVKVGCDFWDGNHSPRFGLVAVGQDCPAPASSTPSGLVVGFDMNPDGNSCPGGGSDCTLDTIDSCREVNPGDTFEFDVFLDHLPTAATPTPTATGTPTTTVTATPTATPAGTPTPGSTPLVTGWNDSCYQGEARAIGDAFAPVIADVQAVYRMKPDQTFEHWFPARSDLSNITTLSPFDQLFILMTADAVWTVQPLAPLASSAPLNSGWNSVCYLGGGKDTAAATAGISGGFSIIYNLALGQTWRRYVPGKPDLSELTRLETFTSVLILMNEGGTWSFSP